jgi:alanyl-tRNA synthetase
VPVNQTGKIIEKFTGEILEYSEKLRKPLERKKASTLKEACMAIFELWKRLKKEIESHSKELADSAAESLVKNAKNNEIFEVVEMERKDMINICNSVLAGHPGFTIILVNGNGEVIGMSDTQDVAKKVKSLCEKNGGAGGGSGRLAQGKLDIKKLKATEKN